jgi:hypothetical protein
VRKTFSFNIGILAENIHERGDIPVKLSVVGSGKSGIWRRERIRMTDQELDDVAFLTGIIDELGQDFFSHFLCFPFVLFIFILLSFCNFFFFFLFFLNQSL